MQNHLCILAENSTVEVARPCYGEKAKFLLLLEMAAEKNYEEFSLVDTYATTSQDSFRLCFDFVVPVK